MNKKISVLTIISLMASNIASVAVSARSRSRVHRSSIAGQARDEARAGLTGELKTPPSRLNCQVGTFEKGDKCEPCTGKPENAVYKDNHCNWSCNTGYIQQGMTCVKKVGDSTFTKEEKLETQKKMTALAKLVGDVKNNCTKLDDDMSEVYGLLAATATMEGLGTGASVAALGTNIAKERKEDISGEEKIKIEEEVVKLKAELEKEQDEEKKKNLEKEIAAKEKQLSGASKKVLNDTTTGLLATSAITGVIGLGTGGAATHKLDSNIKKRMDKCRESIKGLKNKSSAITEKDKEILAVIKAGDEGLEDGKKIIDNDYVLNNAKAIVDACDKISNEESKHNLTLALNLAKSTIGLGTVGTMTSLAGAITSGIAGTDKGKDKAKALDLTTSIMAGVSSGTHGAATATGSISAVKLKALRDDAKTCQAALNQ